MTGVAYGNILLHAASNSMHTLVTDKMCSTSDEKKVYHSESIAPVSTYLALQVGIMRQRNTKAKLNLK